MLGGIGATELTLILAALVLLYGGKKLPEIGSGIGKGIRNFKQAVSGEEKKKLDEGSDQASEKEED